jgi:hypothetical protein
MIISSIEDVYVGLEAHGWVKKEEHLYFSPKLDMYVGPIFIPNETNVLMLSFFKMRAKGIDAIWQIRVKDISKCSIDNGLLVYSELLGLKIV